MASKVILVEPGAYLLTGHYREKLSLWVEAFRNAGWNVSVFCWDAPSDGFLPDVSFVSPPAALRKVAQFFPSRLRVLWLLFWTYLFAFWNSARSGSSVVGLSTSTLLPVAAARAVFGARPLAFGQIVMYGNLFDTKNALRIRIARWSLVSLLRSGAAVFPNTKRTRAIFAEQVVERGLQARIVTHYDPVYVSKTPVQIGQKPSDGPLLVPGLDDHRRSPLAHLEKAHVDPPPRSLYIHAPGRSDKSVSEIRLKASSIVEDVVVSSTYRNQEELCELFASASWCLVAYRPSLSQGSGLLVQSIVSGTPVLCSRFPHADELFQEFGRLGEVFEFDDMNAFRTAWLRLQAWGSREWAEFREARAKLKEQVSPGRIAGSVIQLLETAPLSELIIESHPSNES